MEALNPWRMRVMAAPRKYGDELREWATRMAVEARQDAFTKTGAIKRVADQLGIHQETLRNWGRQAEIDGGTRPGTTSDDAHRLAELERESRELRRANRMRSCGWRRLSRQRSSTAS
jgi:transposase